MQIYVSSFITGTFKHRKMQTCNEKEQNLKIVKKKKSNQKSTIALYCSPITKNNSEFHKLIHGKIFQGVFYLFLNYSMFSFLRTYFGPREFHLKTL